METLSQSSVRRISFIGCDFSQISVDSFSAVTTVPGLCGLYFDFLHPSVEANDALIQNAVANNVYVIETIRRSVEDVSEHSILDFCFPVDEKYRGVKRRFRVALERITSGFVKSFFEVRVFDIYKLTVLA